jgi:hypothetical protein
MGFLLLKLNGFRTSIILKFQKIFYEKALVIPAGSAWPVDGTVALPAPCFLGGI